MKPFLLPILAALLFAVSAMAQTQPTPEWSISNLQLYSSKKIEGANRAVVADKSSLLEVVGNVTYLGTSPAGSRIFLPNIRLSGASSIGAWSVEPIAVGMNGPSGCYSYLFLASISNNTASPPAVTARLDVENGKVRFLAGSAVALCFAFSAPESPAMFHFGFAETDKELVLASARPLALIGPPVVPPLPSRETPSPPSTPPKCDPVEPGYTDEARKARIEGQVTLGIVVHVDGSVEVQKVLKGLGYGLDEEAQAVVSKWKCTPAIVNGQPASVRVQVNINFRLVKLPPNPQ